MTASIAVHQCLFCPQTFNHAADKDDHTLEHFAQETCADCNQNLIRIGADLYTLHDTVTCIKRAVKKEHCLSTSATTDPLVPNENPLDFDSVNCGGGFAAIAISSKSICAQQLEIKREPADVGYSQQLDDPFHSNKIEPNPNCTKFSCEYCRKELLSEPTLDIHVRNCKWKEKLESERTNKVDDMVEKRLMPSSSDVEQQGKQQIAHQENLFVIEKGLEADYSLIGESNVKGESEIDIDMPERYEQDEFDDSDESMDLSDFQEIKMAIRTQMENEKMVNERQCNICHKIMSSAQSLRSHMKWNHNSNFKKPDQRAYIKCDVCDRILYNKGNLQRHKISVHGAPHSRASSSTIQLPENSEQEKIEDFGERMHLNGNQKLETEVQSQKKNVANLMVGENQCSICHKIMSSADSLRNHMKWNHNRDPNFKKRNQKVCAKCDDCNRTFYNKGSLQRHRENVHKIRVKNCTDADKVFECYICHKMSKTKEILRAHLLLIHSNGKKFKCEPCNRSFACKSGYEKHYRLTHLNVRNFVCEICGKSFKTSQKLKLHEYTHTKERPFKCSHDGCDKYFRTPSHKIHHIKTVHLGQKPFRCKIDGCHEEFTWLNPLKKHKLDVHCIPMTK
ncbi:zinc finger protein 845-like [Sitodiplosis mosellana]|uniref:zinc finger protein 845-like n=1 Tax=Sitodiplosis mosellana TaxID=263140 RepID=UPI002443F0E3|nr:zinc finger protein 845-like [Sitodiplosis mosellana]